MGTIFLRTLIIFSAILLLMRLMGKRQLRELEISELVVSVLFADLAASPLQDVSIPLINGLIPILTLFACELVISGAMLSSVRFRTIMCGKPSFLIIKGKIQENEMRKARFSVDELFEELRSKEILDIRTVQYAILETDGTLNTILIPEERPVSAMQMGVKINDSGYPVILIEDGVLLDKNLIHIGRDMRWLKSELKKHGISDIKKVFTLVFYEGGEIYMLPKCDNNA